MKQDPYFKYLAAVILIGVVLAFVDVTPASASVPNTTHALGQ